MITDFTERCFVYIPRSKLTPRGLGKADGKATTDGASPMHVFFAASTTNKRLQSEKSAHHRLISLNRLFSGERAKESDVGGK